MMEGTDVQAANGGTRNKAWAFFRGFLRHPATVASVVPSSRFLTRRIANVALKTRAHTVVELGPGTGCTTRALLKVLPRDARLLAIDLEEDFINLLKWEVDHRLIPHLGSATMVRETVAAHGLPNPDLIVSGIPFSTMAAEDAREICEQVWMSLAPGGSFVAYQLRGHVARYARHWMGAPCMQFEWLNVPPMRVYRWVKPAVE
ncbi:MAG TPA: methyltransferase domain-containing protein [Burkholderiales bacterium]|nr:methyltransferase domain-containing protein [Burkholderiales bacterium]